MFNSKSDGITGLFNIDLFLETLKNDYKSNSFVYLGNLNFDKINNCSSHDNYITNTEEFSNKYQVSFRIIVNENDQFTYLEIMFTDISKITKLEREKTIDNCRSLYLSKVAHEFKNPLTSIIELTNKINDAVKESNPKEEIFSIVHHTHLVCNIMDLFLKDFTLFANNQLSGNDTKCRSSNHLNPNSNEIYQCACSICDIKEFDYYNLISNLVDTFENLSRLEHKELHINFINDKSKNFLTLNLPKKTTIISSKDIFHSILFNILYYSYKNTLNGEINVSYMIEFDKIKFEIKDTGSEIDSQFIQNLKNKNIIFEGAVDILYDNKYLSFNQFNKYLGLYIAYSNAKLIGSSLVLETSKNGTKYTLSLQNTNKDSNNNSMKRNSIKEIVKTNSSVTQFSKFISNDKSSICNYIFIFSKFCRYCFSK
jgi:signal transduction histidine kinase